MGDKKGGTFGGGVEGGGSAALGEDGDAPAHAGHPAQAPDAARAAPPPAAAAGSAAGAVVVPSSRRDPSGDGLEARLLRELRHLRGVYADGQPCTYARLAAHFRAGVARSHGATGEGRGAEAEAEAMSGDGARSLSERGVPGGHKRRRGGARDDAADAAVDAAAEREPCGAAAAPTPAQVGWYTSAAAYWDGVDATQDAMLGEYGCVSPLDVEGSRAFIAALPGGVDVAGPALDCGAGIGRVTKHVLLPAGFASVDLVEQNPRFLRAARAFIASDRLGELFPVGLQEFVFEAKLYSLVWIQWVVAHLSDADFVRFFQRCRAALRPGGFVVLKDNISRQGFVVDGVDSSVTRAMPHLRALFRVAGLRCVAEATQDGFPSEIFPVGMIALQ